MNLSTAPFTPYFLRSLSLFHTRCSTCSKCMGAYSLGLIILYFTLLFFALLYLSPRLQSHLLPPLPPPPSPTWFPWLTHRVVEGPQKCVRLRGERRPLHQHAEGRGAQQVREIYHFLPQLCHRHGHQGELGLLKEWKKRWRKRSCLMTQIKEACHQFFC